MFGFLCLGTTHRCPGISPSRLRVPYVMPGIKPQSLRVRQIVYPLCYHSSPKRKVFLNAFTQQPGKGKKVAQLPLWVQNKPQFRLHLPKIFLHIQACQPVTFRVSKGVRRIGSQRVPKPHFGKGTGFRDSVYGSRSAIS